MLEKDYVTSLIELLNIASGLGNYRKFILTKNPLKFETSGPVKYSVIYHKPEAWNNISMYANDKYGSERFYFNFLLAEETMKNE